MTVVHDDARFPLALGRPSAGGAEWSTEVAEASDGYNWRTGLWSRPLMRWDVGVSLRTAEDLALLRAFHRLRRGRLYGFRIADPLDFSTAGWSRQQPLPPAATDQPLISVGGSATVFQCVIRHAQGAHVQDERVTRPRADGFLVALDGVAQASGWTLDPATGQVTFAAAPGAAAPSWGGFRDFPAVFADDRLEISLSRFNAGEAPQVIIEEVRE